VQAGRAEGGFVTHAALVNARKARARGPKFFDHFSQATLFWASQSAPEKEHIVQALRFELGKVELPEVRRRMVGLLTQVDRTLATQVAEGLGLDTPAGPETPMNRSVPADADPKDHQPRRGRASVGQSAALSMANTVKDRAETRRVAILAADGVDAAALATMRRALTAAGAQAKVVAPRLGTLRAESRGEVPVDLSLLNVGSVLFDAVFVPGGARSIETLRGEARALLFVAEAFKHCKPIAASGAGLELLAASGIPADGSDEAVTTATDGEVEKAAAAFVKAIARHRNWGREARGRQVPV
jgi:catalase